MCNCNVCCKYINTSFKGGTLMLIQKKPVKLSDYYELINPTYVYLKIIPHKSIRNYNTSTIAKAVAHTYKSIDKRIHREQKKIFIEAKFKISYIIDIIDGDVNFYFVIPKIYQSLIVDKIAEIWAKATIEVVDHIKPFNEESITYQLSYKRDDAMSLHVDKKNNEPLNQILNVIQLLKDDDRVTIVYNFKPTNIYDWKGKYEDTMSKIRNGKNIDKKAFTFEYITKGLIGIIASVLDTVLSVLNDFTNGSNKEDKESIYSSIIGVLDEHRALSSSTKAKKESNIISTQIAVVSSSKNKIRREDNAVAVCQAYHVLDEDNELVYKKVKNKINIEDYDFKMANNLCSIDECKNFIQIPGRTLVEEHKIKYIKTEETNIPEELSKGEKYLGYTTYKGIRRDAYLEDEYNIGNLPLVLIGAQGGGKTTYLGNYCSYSNKVNEGVIVVDFIKNCSLSSSIENIVSKDKLIVIDLGKEEDIQGLGYNEIVINDEMSNFQKLNLANMQSQQIMSFVDAISIGDPLSSRMRRFLNSAANLVFVQGYNSIKNVVECLEDFKKRQYYIDNLPKELVEQLEDEINTLNELNEYNNKTNEVVGTKNSKIEHILDRISMLREDFKLKYMYNKNLRNNINLVDCMEQGKVVLIKMREDDFPSKMIKNVLVTYWISKIWLASQIRGSISDKPPRCNIVVDEIFQAPTCMKTLEYILPQSRKFGCKFIFSTQYIKQLDAIADVLEASGSSYMLLKGSLEDDFNHLNKKINGYEFEDLRDMDQYSSLNLIYYSKGYCTFITKLPRPLSA